jgi:hypothetical protein
MSAPHPASAGVAAPQPAGLLSRGTGWATGWATTHPLAVGTVFLLLCGWKFTLGLDHALDIDPHHESMYIGYMLHYYPGGTPSEYSPLYVWLYALEHWFKADIIDVFYLNMALLTVALPVAVFVFLTVKRVAFAVALPSALYLMLVAANLPVRPKPMHLALIVLFFGLAAFVKWRERPERWGFLVVLWAALSLIRPELLYAVILAALYGLWKVATEGRRDRRVVLAVAAAVPVVAALYWSMGLPLFGERSVLALAFHFAANYSSWHHTGDVPFTEDFDRIYASVFGNAKSIPAAFLANPGAFLHSMATNLMHLPKALIGIWLAHFNVLLPRYLPYTFVEAGALGLAAIVGLVWWWRNWQPPAWPGSGIVAATLGGAKRLLGETPETICLVLFLLPYVAMMVIIYPRFHYALAVGLVLAVVAMTGFARRRARVELSRGNLILLPVLLAIVPSLGSVGARIDAQVGQVAAAPLEYVAEARFLQRLAQSAPINVFESTEPGISPYAGPNFRSSSDMDKPHGLSAFLADRDFSVIIEDGRLRDFARYSDDPEWAAFRRAPQEFGFAAQALPGTAAIVYVKQTLLAAAANRTSP